MAESTPEEQAEGFKVGTGRRGRCPALAQGAGAGGGDGGGLVVVQLVLMVLLLVVTCKRLPCKRASAAPRRVPVPLLVQNMGNDALKAGMRHKKKFYLRQASRRARLQQPRRCWCRGPRGRGVAGGRAGWRWG